MENIGVWSVGVKRKMSPTEKTNSEKVGRMEIAMP
jgi:hypothetical protein